MKIVAPLSRIEEIAPLAAAGADEFYCSVVPSQWLARFGHSAVSRRLFSSLANDSDLEPAIAAAQALGKRVSLVMNAQHYTSEQIDCLLLLAQRFAAANGDAVIVAEPVLLSLLAAALPGLALHLSSIAACRNRQSVAFYRQLGATRIIFPRDMTLNEMARLTAAHPELEYEAFVLNDGCVFEEGVCHSIHLPGKLGGAICMDRYRYDYQRIDGQALAADEQAAFSRNDQRYQRWLYHRFGNGFSVTPEGYPFGPCGLCALPRLQQLGVGSVKIAGRDAPLARKLKSVELVAKVRQRLLAGADTAQLQDFAQGLRGPAHRCEDGRMCYYPELLRPSRHSSTLSTLGQGRGLIARG